MIRPSRRSRAAVWLAVLTIACAQPSTAFAATRPGAWRLAAEPHQPLVVGVRELGIGTFHTPGRFFAIGFWQGDEFTGLVRRPDVLVDASNAAVKIQLLLAAQIDSIHLGTSTRQEVDPRTAGATAWEWVGEGSGPTAPGGRTSAGFAAPDTSRGHWRSRTRPDQVLLLSHGDHGESKLFVAGRFAATGFFSGDKFTGLLVPLNDPATTPVRGPRPMSARVTSDTTLALSANPDVPLDSPRAEVWELTDESAITFAARTRAGARDQGGANRLPPADARLPEYGEYVYVEELPVVLTRVQPEYPVAREQGVQGTVIIQVLVSTKGTVMDTRVTKSIPMLDEAATRCVKQWVFRPGMANGQPVAVWLGVPVKFSLH